MAEEIKDHREYCFTLEKVQLTSCMLNINYVSWYRKENLTVQKKQHAAPYRCYVVFAACGLWPIQVRKTGHKPVGQTLRWKK
jgi:hypothetical protein